MTENVRNLENKYLEHGYLINLNRNYSYSIHYFAILSLVFSTKPATLMSLINVLSLIIVLGWHFSKINNCPAFNKRPGSFFLKSNKRPALNKWPERKVYYIIYSIFGVTPTWYAFKTNYLIWSIIWLHTIFKKYIFYKFMSSKRAESL